MTQISLRVGLPPKDTYHQSVFYHIPFHRILIINFPREVFHHIHRKPRHPQCFKTLLTFFRRPSHPSVYRVQSSFAFNPNYPLKNVGDPTPVQFPMRVMFQPVVVRQASWNWIGQANIPSHTIGAKYGNYSRIQSSNGQRVTP